MQPAAVRMRGGYTNPCRVRRCPGAAAPRPAKRPAGPRACRPMPAPGSPQQRDAGPAEGRPGGLAEEDRRAVAGHHEAAHPGAPARPVAPTRRSRGRRVPQPKAAPRAPATAGRNRSRRRGRRAARPVAGSRRGWPPAAMPRPCRHGRPCARRSAGRRARPNPRAPAGADVTARQLRDAVCHRPDMGGGGEGGGDRLVDRALGGEEAIDIGRRHAERTRCRPAPSSGSRACGTVPRRFRGCGPVRRRHVLRWRSGQRGSSNERIRQS